MRNGFDYNNRTDFPQRSPRVFLPTAEMREKKVELERKAVTANIHRSEPAM
jgi:hypothetical protein